MRKNLAGKTTKMKRLANSMRHSWQKAFAVLFFILFLADTTQGAEQLGTVVHYDGNVSIMSEGSIRAQKLKKKQAGLIAGDRLRTKSKSSASVKFIDGSNISLMEHSILHLFSDQKVEVVGGTVLFEIQKRGDVKGLEVSSATVTIGVRGTRFAVEKEDGKMSIYLQRGELQVTSLAEAFKRYTLGGKEEFAEMERNLEESFIQDLAKMKNDFKRTKRQMQKGNIELTQQFLMKAGTAVVIDNGNVRDVQIPASLEKALNILDSF